MFVIYYKYPVPVNVRKPLSLKRVLQSSVISYKFITYRGQAIVITRHHSHSFIHAASAYAKNVNTNYLTVQIFQLIGCLGMEK